MWLVIRGTALSSAAVSGESPQPAVSIALIDAMSVDLVVDFLTRFFTVENALAHKDVVAGITALLLVISIAVLGAVANRRIAHGWLRCKIMHTYCTNCVVRAPLLRWAEACIHTPAPHALLLLVR